MDREEINFSNAFYWYKFSYYYYSISVCNFLYLYLYLFYFVLYVFFPEYIDISGLCLYPNWLCWHRCISSRRSFLFCRLINQCLQQWFDRNSLEPAASCNNIFQVMQIRQVASLFTGVFMFASSRCKQWFSHRILNYRRLRDFSRFFYNLKNLYPLIWLFLNNKYSYFVRNLYGIRKICVIGNILN